MDHKCDMCGKPATVHITKIIDGKKTKLHLCQDCAQNGSAMGEAFPAEILPNIKKLEEQILEIAHPKKGRPDVSCPKCGTTLAAFDKRGRFTCPDCYKAFEAKVLDMLAHMHGAVKHKGKQPKKFAPKKRRDVLPEADSPQLEIKFADKKPPKKDFKFEDLQFEPAPASKDELLTELKSALSTAVKEERYEDAAGIRDEINKLEE